MIEQRGGAGAARDPNVGDDLVLDDGSRWRITKVHVAMDRYVVAVDVSERTVMTVPLYLLVWDAGLRAWTVARSP